MGKTFPVPLKISYLAAPYRGKTINETRVNIRYAESVAAKLWAQGYYVFCPHMNTAFFDTTSSRRTAYACVSVGR